MPPLDATTGDAVGSTSIDLTTGWATMPSAGSILNLAVLVWVHATWYLTQ